ncbi:hypothetical protein NLG97_g2543 [Lecanicillium saksenae]|uniref:Uncharacterized protein n=1 Tax=Lecanicillium saksenae TaxID=468837 RepID=A0ACC1R4N7_9HYPO|nr:hypothetical protein NLG97_g2543 [Lecanicillium saksenae]
MFTLAPENQLIYKQSTPKIMSIPTVKKTKILSLGLPRTGSASIATALEILGYNVCHGKFIIDSKAAWDFLVRACDASFPTLPTYTGVPLRARNGLIEAYPDAKVILGIRDFEPWLRSLDEGVLQVSCVEIPNAEFPHANGKAMVKTLFYTEFGGIFTGAAGSLFSLHIYGIFVVSLRGNHSREL